MAFKCVHTLAKRLHLGRQRRACSSRRRPRAEARERSVTASRRTTRWGPWTLAVIFDGIYLVRCHERSVGHHL
jgi:hypothetical protein